MFVIINHGIAYILGQHERELKEKKMFFPEQRWSDFYQQEKVDLIFVGSSHAYRSYIPSVFDSTLNINSFNLGSSAQTPVTSYFVLKEVLEHYTPNTMVLDVYFLALKNEYQLKNGRWNYDQFKSTKVKREFWWDGFSFSEKLTLAFCPF